MFEVLPRQVNELPTAPTGPADCPRCCKPGIEVDRANGVTIYACDRLDQHANNQPIRWSRADDSYQMPMNKAKYAPKAYQDEWRQVARWSVLQSIGGERHPSETYKHGLRWSQETDGRRGRCMCGYETLVTEAELDAAVETRARQAPRMAGQSMHFLLDE